jgi:hypothetical protein
MTDYMRISPDDVQRLNWVRESPGGVTTTDSAFVYLMSMAGLVQTVGTTVAEHMALVITDKGRKFLAAHRQT